MQVTDSLGATVNSTVATVMVISGSTPTPPPVTPPPVTPKPTQPPDTTPPSGTVKLYGSETKTSTASIILSLSATDASGLAQMRFSNDNTEFSQWQTYNSTVSWKLTEGAGEKTVYVQFKDNKGNIGYAQATISLDIPTKTATPTPTSIPQTATGEFPILAIAAIVVVIVVIAVLLLLKLLRRPKRPMTPTQIKVTAEPTNIVANGEERSVITLQLLDKNGKPMLAPSDTIIKVQAGKGKLEPAVITIPKGKDAEKTVLVSSNEIGPVPVSADAEGLKSITITLNFTERTRYCMHCGTQMSIKDKACRNCGKTPPAGADTKTCQNCQVVIPIVAKFCSECGAGQQAV